MGAASSQTSAPTTDQLFTVVGHDEPSGITLLLENHTGNQYCMKQVTTNSKHDVEVFGKHIAEKQQNKHPNLVSVVYYKVQPADGLCSQSSRCYIITEHPFRTLYDEVRDRRMSQQPFSEGEILSILYSCVAGLQHLYAHGFKHQSLTSNRVYIDKSGLIKISDPQLLRQPDNISSLASHSNKQHIYLSPEQLRASFGRQHQQYDSSLSEVFTLGMIMLEALQLEWMDEMYDPTSLNTARLKAAIEQLDLNCYGRQLRALIRGMVEKQPENRLTLKEVSACIDEMDIPETPKKQSRRSNKASEAERFDPSSLRSSHLHQTYLPSRVVVNVQHLHIDPDKSCSQSKNEARTKVSSSHGKPGTESSQSTPMQSSVNMFPQAFTVKTTKAVPHKIIQLDVGRSDQQHPKKNTRERSRSGKSFQQLQTSASKKKDTAGSFKKKETRKEGEHSSKKETKPQETPNKIYKQFYPYTEFVEGGLRESNKVFDGDNIPYIAPTKPQEKCIRVDLFSGKKRHSSKVKNSASISNSPRPVVAVKKFEVLAPPPQMKHPEEHFQRLPHTEPTLRGTPERQLTTGLVEEAPERQLRIKTDYYYEQRYLEQEVRHQNAIANRNRSVAEFCTRIQISNSISVHSPVRLRADTVDQEEQVVLYRIPAEPERKKKITFGLEQSSVNEEARQPFKKQSNSLTYFVPLIENPMADEAHKCEQKPTDTSLKESEPLRIDITLPAEIVPCAALLRKSLKEAIASEEVLPSTDARVNQLEYINETYKHGGRYQGFKLNGLRQGFGRYYYQDGGYYQGEWHCNKMQGFAKLYYQNGDLAYEGYWKGDMFNGVGKLWNDSPQPMNHPFHYPDFSKVGNSWAHYKGSFVDDVRTGFGTLTLTNGEIFEGEFRQDRVHGPGKFYSMDGRVHHGNWLADRLSL